MRALKLQCYGLFSLSIICLVLPSMLVDYGYWVPIPSAQHAIEIVMDKLKIFTIITGIVALILAVLDR